MTHPANSQRLISTMTSISMSGSLANLPSCPTRDPSLVPSPPSCSLSFQTYSPLIKSTFTSTRNPSKCHTYRHRPLSLIISSIPTVLTSPPLIKRFAQAAVINFPLYLAVNYKIIPQQFLTSLGLKHALYLGILLWTTSGPPAYILVFSFLLLGSFATRLGRKQKSSLGIAEKREGRRSPEQLWGAAGIASICSILSPLLQVLSFNLLSTCMKVAFCGAVAAKCSDTISSEIGKAYGGTTYLITNFKKVQKGTEGAISLEGTIAGILASILTSLLGLKLGLFHGMRLFGVVIIAGVLANLSESVIGASLQELVNLSNEQVNFINTAIGASIAFVASFLLLL